MLISACKHGITTPPPPRPIPDVLPELPPAHMIATRNTTMVIGVDGTLWGKGDNILGELGDGTTRRQTFFDQVGTDSDWAWVDTGHQYTVAIRTDGTLWAWGSSQFAWIQWKHDLPRSVTVPTQVGADTDWMKVAAGSGLTIAIKKDGSLWSWGSNGRGSLGVGYRTMEYSLTPRRVGTSTEWAYVFAYGLRAMAIKTDGSLWGWGANAHGSLGDGTGENQFSPVNIMPGMTWSTVALGSGHTLAIGTDGSLWAWGSNEFGQIGDGTRTIRRSPVQIGTYTDWTSVAGGGMYTIATREDGSLWVWGSQIPLFFGGLAVRDHTIPTQIHPYEHWVSVAAGNNRAFAVTKDGRIKRLG